MITPGKFMVGNGILCVGVLYLASLELEPGNKLLGSLGMALLAYFWLSLWLYLHWFRSHSRLDTANEREVRAVLAEWEGCGPFGRNQSHIRRVLGSNDTAAKAQAKDRLLSIYEALVRLDPKDSNAAQELEKLRAERERLRR